MRIEVAWDHGVTAVGYSRRVRQVVQFGLAGVLLAEPQWAWLKKPISVASWIRYGSLASFAVVDVGELARGNLCSKSTGETVVDATEIICDWLTLALFLRDTGWVNAFGPRWFDRACATTWLVSAAGRVLYSDSKKQLGTTSLDLVFAAADTFLPAEAAPLLAAVGLASGAYPLVVG